MGLKTWLKLAVVAGVAANIAGTAFAGGTLRYATIGEPPSLDQQVITSDLATTIAHHIFEGLYTFNAAYEPVPLLAESETLSDGGKVITITLRKNVRFHNGQPMTAADVVASLQRWGHTDRAAGCSSTMSSVSRPPASTR